MAAKPNTKIVRCCHCGGMMRVAARAMSVFCPHCQKRAPLESFRITGSHPGRTLATCGDIHIEKTAILNLEILGTNVFVNGRVRGGVTAGSCLEIGPNGSVIGEVKAARIIVQDGGFLEGRCEMTLTGRLQQPSAEDEDHEQPIDEEAPRHESLVSIADAHEASRGMVRPRPLPSPGR